MSRDDSAPDECGAVKRPRSEMLTDCARRFEPIFHFEPVIASIETPTGTDLQHDRRL